jgi:type I restriction enzyme S subunit
MVPDGWIASTLCELATFRSGGTPSKEREDFWDGSLPWVSAKDLKKHLIDDAIDHLTDAGATSAKTAEPGSILMLVRGMTLMKDVPISFVTKMVAFNQDIKALVAKDSVEPSFLAYALVAKKRPMMGLVNTANDGTGRLDTELLKSLPLGGVMLQMLANGSL